MGFVGLSDVTGGLVFMVLTFVCCGFVLPGSFCTVYLVYLGFPGCMRLIDWSSLYPSTHRRGLIVLFELFDYLTRMLLTVLTGFGLVRVWPCVSILGYNGIKIQCGVWLAFPITIYDRLLGSFTMYSVFSTLGGYIEYIGGCSGRRAYHDPSGRNWEYRLEGVRYI